LPTSSSHLKELEPEVVVLGMAHQGRPSDLHTPHNWKDWPHTMPCFRHTHQSPLDPPRSSTHLLASLDLGLVWAWVLGSEMALVLASAQEAELCIQVLGRAATLVLAGAKEAS